MENEIREMQDQEISLKEIIEILLKRKYVILGSVIICVLVSFIVSFFVLQPVYESKSSYSLKPIAIATGINPSSTIILSTDTNTLENARVLENRMLSSILRQLTYPNFDVPTMVNNMKSYAYLTDILSANNIDITTYDYTSNIAVALDATTGLVNINVKYGDPDTAIKIKDGIIGGLPNMMQNMSTGRLDTIDKTISTGIESELKNIANLSSSKSGLASSDLILSQQTIDSYKLIAKELVTIKKIDVVAMMNVQQITNDTLPLSPISPNKTMNLAVSLMLGLMIGVFLAFFLDYLSREFGLKI